MNVTEIVNKKVKRLNLAGKPKVLRTLVQRPYAFAEVSVSGKKGYGFSKCSPKDVFDLAIGLNIAISRAIDRAVEKSV